jgi:hypothetical protein
MPRLPAPVRELAGLSLQDGWVEAVVWEAAGKRLRLSVVTPHSSGYLAVALSYSGALLGSGAFKLFATQLAIARRKSWSRRSTATMRA